MTTVEKSKEEIQQQIDRLELAIKNDGFKPAVDGTRYREHLYYTRKGAIDYLKWTIKTKEDEQREQEDADRQVSEAEYQQALAEQQNNL